MSARPAGGVRTERSSARGAVGAERAAVRWILANGRRHLLT